MFGIDYEPSVQKPSLGFVKLEKYPFLDEMRQKLHEIVNENKKQFESLSRKERDLLYLESCRKAHEAFRAKIDGSEVSILNLPQER